MDLAIDVDDRDEVVIVRLAGEVDLATVPLLRERLQSLDAAGRSRLVIDLGAVGFVDSTGLGVLIGALKRARSRGGWLVLACCDERLQHVLDVSGLDAVFAVYPDVDVALERAA